MRAILCLLVAVVFGVPSAWAKATPLSAEVAAAITTIYQKGFLGDLSAERRVLQAAADADVKDPRPAWYSLLITLMLTRDWGSGPRPELITQAEPHLSMLILSAQTRGYTAMVHWMKSGYAELHMAYDEGIRELEEARRLEPANPEYAFFLALAWSRSGQWYGERDRSLKAIAILKSLLTQLLSGASSSSYLKPYYIQYTIAQTYRLMKQPDSESAMSYFQNVLDATKGSLSDSRLAWSLLEMARIQLGLDRCDQAAEFSKRALEVSGSDVDGAKELLTGAEFCREMKKPSGA